jgi:hypothetical protein
LVKIYWKEGFYSNLSNKDGKGGMIFVNETKVQSRDWLEGYVKKLRGSYYNRVEVGNMISTYLDELTSKIREEYDFHGSFIYNRDFNEIALPSSEDVKVTFERKRIIFEKTYSYRTKDSAYVVVEDVLTAYSVSETDAQYLQLENVEYKEFASLKIALREALKTIIIKPLKEI